MTDNFDLDSAYGMVARLRGMAASLEAVSSELDSSEATGSDETGTVTATVGHGGTLKALVISEDWKRAFDPSQLGQAILGALRKARAEFAGQFADAAERAAGNSPVVNTSSTYERPRSTELPSMAELTERISALRSANDEMDSYREAVRSELAGDTATSPAGYFEVRYNGPTVASLTADEYRLTFASAAEIASDATTVIIGARDRLNTRDEILAARFPAIAAIQQRLAEDA